MAQRNTCGLAVRKRFLNGYRGLPSVSPSVRETDGMGRARNGRPILPVGLIFRPAALRRGAGFCGEV